MRVDIRRLSLSVSAGSKTGQVIPFVCWSPSSIGNAGRQICNICDGKYQEEFKKRNENISGWLKVEMSLMHS